MNHIYFLSRLFCTNTRVNVIAAEAFMPRKNGHWSVRNRILPKKNLILQRFVFLAQNLVVWGIVQSLQNSLLAVLKQCIFFTRDKTCVPQIEIKEWMIMHIMKQPEKFTNYHNHRVTIKNILIMDLFGNTCSNNELVC